jgi:hypothetical protein
MFTREVAEIRYHCNSMDLAAILISKGRQGGISVGV